MKKLWIHVVVLGIGFAAGAYWISGTKAEQYKQQLHLSEGDWEAEKARLQELLNTERNKPPQVKTVYKDIPASYTNRLSPREVLDKLVTLKPDEEDNLNQAFRKVIFYMQSLAEAGPIAFPVIHEFLAKNVDVDYSEFEVTASGERAPRNSFASRNVVRTDFLVPPSLRLGLLGVLGQIGGSEAEQILGETLATCARGVEVAYLARILQDLTPGKYQAQALQAARELLTNPPPFESPNRLDENAKAYLYQVLAMYNDTSFAETAQSLILTPEGRVDQSALNYLISVLKDQAVPAMMTAYNDPRLSNQMERTRLLNAALAYTGPSAVANQMFSQTITNTEIPAGMRAFTVQGLAGTSQIAPPKDTYTIQTRLRLLEALRASIQDERLLSSVDSTRQKLERLLTDAAPQN